MDSEDLARRLYSDWRRGWQDPVATARSIGITRGMTVADLGCGPGFFTVPLASMVGEDGLVYAVDSDPTMLRHLRANVKREGMDGKNVRIVRASVSRTGIPSSSVEVVLLSLILHDVDDRERFLREIGRVSKPGALVADVDWRKVRSSVGPPVEMRLGKGESMKLFSDGGYRVLRSIPAGPHLYGFVCRA